MILLDTNSLKFTVFKLKHLPLCNGIPCTRKSLKASSRILERCDTNDDLTDQMYPILSLVQICKLPIIEKSLGSLL